MTRGPRSVIDLVLPEGGRPEPRSLLAEVVLGGGPTGRTARRLLPILVVLPVIGLVRFLAEDAGIVDSLSGTIAMTLAGTILIALVMIAALASLRSAERSREQAERSLERFFDLSIDLFVEAGFDGRFRRINAAWRAALGHPDEVLTSRPFMEFVHPDDRVATRAALAGLREGREVIRFENRYGAADGTYRRLQWNARAFLEQGLIRAVARDVTEEREEDARLARLSAELDAEREAARVAAEQASQAKSDFLAAMSHELRTPLNAILGFSDLMREERHPDGTLHVPPEWAEHVHRGGQHLLGLINDILDLSKVEAGRLELQPTVLDLTSAVEEAVEGVRPLAERKGLGLRSDVPRGLIVSADRTRFRQVLYNLLSNAIKHTPEGGKIRVEAAEGEAEVNVAVVDDGVGISAEDQERIFDAFWQVRADRGWSDGTGLGLSLSRRLMEAHGGRLSVTSALGQGSTFTAHFPRPAETEQPAVIEGGRETSRSQVVREGGRILVVEDDADTVRLLRTYLETDGYVVDVAADGEEAISAARAEPPDAILLDVLLPDIDGWEVLRRLKEDRATESIPVVFETVVDERRVGIAMGAADYLLKPIERRQLLDTVARVLRPSSDGHHPPRILAVDDEPPDLEVVTATLEAAGYDVTGVTSGSEVLRAVGRIRPDVVVCDLIMPPPDGFEVIRSLREDDPTAEIPVIVLTAHDLTRAERERLNQRVVTVLAKATGREELVDWLRRIVPTDSS